MKIDLTPSQVRAVVGALENVDAAGDFSEWAEATPTRERAAMRAGLARLRVATATPAERRLSGAESDLQRLGYRLVGGEWRKGAHE
jgi:hypothetical protein